MSDVTGTVTSALIVGNVQSQQITGSVAGGTVLNPQDFVPYIGATNNVDTGNYGITSAFFDFTVNPATFNYYVSTAGSDSNDGLTALTPFLTIEKALNSIPLFMGRIYQVNIANGTYVLSAEYTTPAYYGVFGDLDSTSLVKIVGNATTPSSVKISSVNTSTVCFKFRGANTKYFLQGIEFNNVGGAFIADACIVEWSGCLINGHFVSGINAQNGATVTLDDTSVGNTFINSGASSSIICSNGATVNINCSTAWTLNSTGSAISASSGTIVQATTKTYTVTGNALSRAAYNVTGSGLLALRGTNNLIDILSFSSAGNGAIRALTGGRVSMTAGSTINFTNCHTGWQIDGVSSVTEGNTCTYNYTTVTRRVLVQYGANIDSTNFLGASGNITYAGGTFAGPIFGYDGKYIQLGGYVDTSYVTKAVSYPIALTDHIIEATVAGITITLPTAVGITGQEFIIDNSSVGSVTIATISGQTIDGSAPSPLLTNTKIKVYSNGANWRTF